MIELKSSGDRGGLVVADMDTSRVDEVVSLGREMGFSPHVCADGRGVYDLVEQYGAPCMVVAGPVLRDMSGRQLFHVLRRGQQTKHVPMVLFSQIGSPWMPSVSQASKLMVVQVPCSPSRLKAALEVTSSGNTQVGQEVKSGEMVIQ